MDDKTISVIANSASAVETIKRLRPSSLFLGILIFGLAFTIRLLFSYIAGYSLMVWIWFSIAAVTGVVAIWAYKVDMVAFTKSNIYNELTSKLEDMDTNH